MRATGEDLRGAALVTGASSGIGSELARLLAADGRDVALVARRAERLAELASELERRFGVRAVALPADLGDTDGAQKLHEEIGRRGMEIDILVNNAGFAVYGDFVDTDQEEETNMLQVNVMALVGLTKLFVRDMVRRGRGRVLNVGSTASFAPAPMASLYGASKAFVLSFSEALHEELKGTGVTVTALCPGPTSTEFADRARMTDAKIFGGRVMSARGAAEIGRAAMMAGRPVAIAGTANKLLIWSMRLTSRAMVARISKGMMSRRPGALRAGVHHA